MLTLELGVPVPLSLCTDSAGGGKAWLRPGTTWRLELVLRSLGRQWVVERGKVQCMQCIYVSNESMVPILMELVLRTLGIWCVAGTGEVQRLHAYIHASRTMASWRPIN